MKYAFFATACAFALLAALSLPASARIKLAAPTVSPSGLSAHDVWFRFIMKDSPAAGYLTLKNDSDANIVMTGAVSPACGHLMMHESKSENGIQSMEMADSVTIPAHGAFSFAPGGYHLMCMDVTDKMVIGQHAPLTLEFAGGMSLTVQAAVKKGDAE